MEETWVNNLNYYKTGSKLEFSSRFTCLLTWEEAFNVKDFLYRTRDNG